MNELTGREYTESKYRKQYQAFQKMLKANANKFSDAEKYLNEIKEVERSLHKERIKLQTEKLEYNRWLREDARDEMFEEKVIASIRENSGKTAPPTRIPSVPNKRHGLLNIADMHFGKEFQIYGVKNELINAYSPEIFYERMNRLFNETVELVQKEHMTDIHIFNLGDALEGFLRHSQLWTLRFGVIDSANIFGEYMGKWLRALSSYVNITYYQTVGNHGELRLLDGRKGEHLSENIEKVTGNYIRIINEDNPNFKMVENRSGFIFAEIAGYNVLGIHGEVKNLAAALKEYSDIYDVKISYIVAGHKHHSEFSNCGVRKGCIGVGSIVGVDDFSMRLRKAADATASFVVFEEGKGKVDEHTFVLN